VGAGTSDPAEGDQKTHYEENGEVGGASCLSTLVFDPFFLFFNFFISFFALFIIFLAFFISFFAFFDLSFLATANLLCSSPEWRKPRQRASQAEAVRLSRTSIRLNARATPAASAGLMKNVIDESGGKRRCRAGSTRRRITYWDRCGRQHFFPVGLLNGGDA
jgi:hypothetical protein